MRLVSLESVYGLVRLVSQGQKKVSETGLSTIRKWANEINLTRIQKGFVRLVSLVLGYRPVRLVSVNTHRVYVRLVSPVYKKQVERLVSDCF